ncbi:PREDICTED: uncharacterized protein LOC104810445 [Tarenaya hassleriana]|uniref:uncharacterized protein LOC104810445 n=1 Tax=Tarenaya hassleriana TaxID=28532 RepID=UPI00053C3E58|nr:PREDICTED: uncharacterized protein LOC104810445 [Tarenaya hassleriana]
MSIHLGTSLEMAVCPCPEAKPFSCSSLPSIQHARFHKTASCWKYREPIIWKTPDSVVSLKNLRLHNLRSIVCMSQLYSTCHSHSKKSYPCIFKAQATDKDGGVERRGAMEQRRKEEERRRKIGIANKGKVPWNKGKQHTEETRVRIKQRTIEALRNPEVRRKMSEHPQPHSDETKEKIRSSVTRVWAERTKLKRSKERFISSWSENIAEAAKRGGKGQEHLDWDSYDRMKEEILFEQIQLAEEKARSKEEAKLRAEAVAQARAEKTRRLAEKRKEREEKAITKAKSGKKTYGLKLKQRLTKIHKKKPRLGRVDVKKGRVDSVTSKWEKLDLDFIQKERMVREFSLADQIQAAKSRRSAALYQHWPDT